MTHLLKQREKLFNQKYWGKLRSKEWLNKGDPNTKFFQRSVNAQRKKNRVVKIKDACGVWLNDQQAIVAKVISDAKNVQLIKLSDI